MKLLKDLKIEQVENLISLAVFGSYETKYWTYDKSDIDILVLMEKREDIMDELDLEEIIEPILQDHFEYDNIHFTFMNMRDYDSVFARQYLDSKDKLILNELKEIDFKLYVNKYLRGNKWLRNRTEADTRLIEGEEMAAAYYKYKKESLNLKFNSAKDTLKLMQGAIEEYKSSNSMYLKRAIIGYFQDFSEYVVDMSETYLVMTENYVDGYSGAELIKRAGFYGFFDEDLTKFLVGLVKIRNRYTHDYYKRERVEEDILNYAVLKMQLLEIFLSISKEKIRMDAKNI